MAKSSTVRMDSVRSANGIPPQCERRWTAVRTPGLAGSKTRSGLRLVSFRLDKAAAAAALRLKACGALGNMQDTIREIIRGDYAQLSARERGTQ